MAPVHADVLVPHQPPLRAVRGKPSHPHADDVLVQVAHLQVGLVEVAEQEVGVGGNPVALVVQPVPFDALAADVARGVQRQPPVAHLPLAVLPAYPVAHHPPGVVEVDEQPVAVHEVRPGPLELGCDAGHRMRRIQEVVAVQQPHHVARGGPDALVDGLVHPPVRFRDDSCDAVAVTSDFPHRAVAARPVHHDVFDVGPVLGKHALDGLPHGRLAVEARGDDGYFHFEYVMFVSVFAE